MQAFENAIGDLNLSQESAETLHSELVSGLVWINIYKQGITGMCIVPLLSSPLEWEHIFSEPKFEFRVAASLKYYS
jgi:hypothetical protein